MNSVVLRSKAETNEIESESSVDSTRFTVMRFVHFGQEARF